MHIAELGAVALVKNQHHMLFIHHMPLVFADESIQLLNGGDDDADVLVFQLFFEYLGRCVAVCRTFFKKVILDHRLVVEVLSVNDKEHLIHRGQSRGELSRLKTGECLARSGGMPNIAPRFNRPRFFVVGGHFDTADYFFGGGYLIWAHHQEQLFGRKHAVAREDIQKGMPCKKGFGKAGKIRNHSVPRVRPVACKFKAVARLFAVFCAAVSLFFDVLVARGVGIVF